EVTSALDQILDLDRRRRALIQAVEAEQRQRKIAAQQYAAAKRAGQEVSETSRERDTLAELTAELDEVQALLRARPSELPTLPADDVVPGGKENNRVLKTFGAKPEIPGLREHASVARNYGLVDFDRGVKLGGSGFWIYTGLGARLEWALINWFIDR